MGALEAFASTSIARFKAGLMEMEANGLGVQIETQHEFSDGMVARTIRIPAGMLLAGVRHKHEHLNICHGHILVKTEDGVVEIEGHRVLPSMPGLERVGFTLAETVWTTVHLNPANERDITKLEDALVFDAHQLQSRRNLLEN